MKVDRAQTRLRLDLCSTSNAETCTTLVFSAPALRAVKGCIMKGLFCLSHRIFGWHRVASLKAPRDLLDTLRLLSSNLLTQARTLALPINADARAGKLVLREQGRIYSWADARFNPAPQAHVFKRSKPRNPSKNSQKSFPDFDPGVSY